MKSKLIVAGAIAAISLLLLACSPTSKQVSVEASCDDFADSNHISKQIEVAVGDSFAVTLCSNPTTGFMWPDEPQIGDQTVLQQTAHEFVPPGGEGVVGASGKDVWTFQALKKGTTEVSMEYSRPFEGGEEGVWAFVLTVAVK